MAVPAVPVRHLQGRHPPKTKARAVESGERGAAIGVCMSTVGGRIPTRTVTGRSRCSFRLSPASCKCSWYLRLFRGASASACCSTGVVCEGTGREAVNRWAEGGQGGALCRDTLGCKSTLPWTFFRIALWQYEDARERMMRERTGSAGMVVPAASCTVLEADHEPQLAHSPKSRRSQSK